MKDLLIITLVLVLAVITDSTIAKLVFGLVMTGYGFYWMHTAEKENRTSTH